MSALAHRRRRTIRRKPVAHSLKQGQCMLAVAGECSGNLYNVGLRDDYDVNAVLHARPVNRCFGAAPPEAAATARGAQSASDHSQTSPRFMAKKLGPRRPLL